MKSNKPKIIFKDSLSKWQSSTLNKVMDRVKSYPLSRSIETKIESGYKHVHYGDIHTGIAELISKSSDLPFIMKGDYELLKKGDIILADASEDYQGIAKPAVVLDDLPYKLIAGLHTIALRPKNLDSLFLYYSMHARDFRKYGYKNGTGMKVFGISLNNVLKYELNYPSVQTQYKIGTLLKSIDDTIFLNQQELDALKQTKQGFLQKMFPIGEEILPTIRFNSYVEAWKQDEFGKVIKLVGGATPLKENKEYWIGNIVWLSSQEIKNKYVFKGTYTISEKAVMDNRTKVVPIGTPLIVTRSGILAKRFPISISSNEVAINQDIKALIFDKTKFDTEFIVAQIKAKESYILKNIVKTGTTVQSVNLPDLNRMILHIPEYEEQVKIGDFFKKMDEVIELKEQELEALKQTKKGFLQKMFV